MSPNFPASPPATPSPHLFFLVPPQQKTPPHPVASPCPKLPRPPQHLLPDPGDSLFLFLANRPLPSRKTPPHPMASPHPQTFPPFPTSIAQPGCLSLFIPGQSPSSQRENTSPPDRASPRPKTSRPSHHLLPDPVDSLFLCPAHPPTSSFYIPTRQPPQQKTPPRLTGPPRTPKLPHPPQHLLPDPVASLFLCLANRSQQKTIAPPHTPKLPRYPSERPSPFLLYVHPTAAPPGGVIGKKPLPPQRARSFVTELLSPSPPPRRTPPSPKCDRPKIEKRSCPGGGTAPFGFFWVHFELFWVGFGLFRAVQR